MTRSAAKGPVKFVELELTGECEPFRRSSAYIGTMSGDLWMPAEYWKRVIASAVDAGVELVQFTGSKSALFPDLVEYALAAGVKVDVHSPFVHVHDGIWELLALPDVSLAICWYAVDPPRHAELTQTEGSWFRARQNVAAALDRGLAPRAEVVTVADGESITHARAELNRLGINVINLDRARSASLAAEDGTVADLCSGCGNGRAGVTWYGAVVPCVVLGRHLAAEDAKETPFADIVSGPQWREVVASIPHGQTPHMCMGAEYIEGALRRS